MNNHLSFNANVEANCSAQDFSHVNFTKIRANKVHGSYIFFENSLKILLKAHKISVRRSVKRERLLKNILSLRKIKKLNHFCMVFPSHAEGRLSAFRFLVQLILPQAFRFFPCLFNSQLSQCVLPYSDFAGA